MGFTLVGYYESQAATGLTLVKGIADQHVNVQLDNIRIPDFANKLLAAAATGITLTEAQISTPSLEAQFVVDLAPLGAGAIEPPGTVDILNDFLPIGLPLVSGEDMRFKVDNTGVAEDQIGLVWLFDTIDPVPPGKINTVKATSATTLVVNTWTICPLTFTQQLPAGRYAIVGMRAESATGTAARLVIPGTAKRPGVICTDAVIDIVSPLFRKGKLGNWGEFEHTYPPQVEFLATTADAAETVYLDLVGPL